MHPTVSSTSKAQPTIMPASYQTNQAYVRGRSNAVQMARIAAYTLVACCFILGFFLLASSYVTASFSASLHKELYHEDRPIYERLIDPLEAESRHRDEPQEAVEAPEPRDIPDAPEALKNTSVQEEESKEEPKEPTKEAKEESKENEHQIAIKLPINLDMDDIAAMAGQVNCAVERRLVTPPGIDGLAVAVICSSGPREWNEERDEPEIVRQLVQQQLEEGPQHPLGTPQRLIFRQLLVPPPFMHHSPIPQMNSNSIEDSSEEGIVRLIADNFLRMMPDARESPRAQGRAIHAPGLTHSLLHPQARAVHQMYSGRPPVEVQRMLQILQAREESRPEIMQVRVPVESMMQVRAPEFQRPPVEAFRPPMDQMRMIQARMMKPLMQMRPPMSEGIVQVRPEGMVQVTPNGIVQVRPVTENNRPEGMVPMNPNVVQIRPPMETMRPPMESMRSPVEDMRPPMQMRSPMEMTHMEMRSPEMRPPMEPLVEMRPPMQQIPSAQPRMDDFEQTSAPELRPHLVQPRSVRSVDHPRDKRERRFA